jgi:hypothetical protein
MTSISMP